MAADRWSTRKVEVVGPSGRSTRAEARVLAPKPSGTSTVVSVLIVAVLVTTSFFVPPVLLLNIPLLIFRSMLMQASADRQRRVALPGLTCPECDATSVPVERRGELPLSETCAACRAPLIVQQPPRLNLVDTPSPSA